MAKKRENFLDYVPAISARNTWDIQGNGLVTVHMIHHGFYAWIARTFFRCPRISHIELDIMGSFIFQRLDGRHTVGAIAELVKEEFGRDAEPLYGRLVKYMQTLRGNGFIYYIGKDKAPK